MAAYLRAWVQAYPEARSAFSRGRQDLGDFLEEVAFHCDAGRWNPSGSYVRGRINEANRCVQDWQLRGLVPKNVPTIATGIRDSRKELRSLVPVEAK